MRKVWYWKSENRKSEIEFRIGRDKKPMWHIHLDNKEGRNIFCWHSHHENLEHYGSYSSPNYWGFELFLSNLSR